MNPKSSFLGGLQLGYIWPSGSEAFNGAGPAYKFNPIIIFPIGYLLALNINFAFLDKPFTIPTSENPVRRVAFAPTVGGTWRSPGATMENLVVGYNSVAGQFSLINVLTQQVGRHIGLTLGAAYNRSSTEANAADGLISLDNKTHVHALSFGFTYQWGESEVFNVPGAPAPNRCKNKQPTC